MTEFIEVFGEKMREMGMNFDWNISDTHIQIETDMGISNLLRPALAYCFQHAYRFDHNGIATIVGKVTRPPLADDDAIIHMYHKWQTKLTKQNSRK